MKRSYSILLAGLTCRPQILSSGTGFLSPIVTNGTYVPLSSTVIICTEHLDTIYLLQCLPRSSWKALSLSIFPWVVSRADCAFWRRAFTWIGYIGRWAIVSSRSCPIFAVSKEMTEDANSETTISLRYLLLSYKSPWMIKLTSFIHPTLFSNDIPRHRARRPERTPVQFFLEILPLETRHCERFDGHVSSSLVVMLRFSTYTSCLRTEQSCPSSEHRRLATHNSESWTYRLWRNRSLSMDALSWHNTSSRSFRRTVA